MKTPIPVGEHDSEPVAFWRAEFTAQTSRKSQNPQKVKEMKAVFIAEAKKYQVFSLDASVAARIVAPRPNITAGRNTFVYAHPMVGLPQGDSPGRLNSSYSVGADINDADYQPPFRFTGTLNKLMIKLDRPQLSAEDIKSLEAAMRTKAISV
jgi:hypothetical protein